MTYALDVQNRVQKTLLFKFVVYTVTGLLLVIFQFKCVSPTYVYYKNGRLRSQAKII